MSETLSVTKRARDRPHQSRWVTNWDHFPSNRYIGSIRLHDECWHAIWTQTECLARDTSSWWFHLMMHSRSARSGLQVNRRIEKNFSDQHRSPLHQVHQGIVRGTGARHL